MKGRIRFGLVVVAVLFLVASVVIAFPAPSREYDPIESCGLNLEIRSRGELLYQDGDNSDNINLTLTLTNLTDRVRVIEEMPTMGNRLGYCWKFLYIAQFPDGEVCEMESYQNPPDPQTIKKSNLTVGPVTIPPKGVTSCVINLNNTLTGSGFHPLYKKNKKLFCMTVVVESLELQSNTICYNKCPAPPKGYAPLRGLPQRRRDRQAKSDAEEEERLNFANYIRTSRGQRPLAPRQQEPDDE